MTDFALGFDVERLQGDLALDGRDIEAESSLRTAVLLSLGTDRRAEVDDSIPDGTGDRRGWWADTFAEVQGDRIGSRLWLLRREKQTTDVLNRAREYAEEALAWLLEDGIASAVQIEAEYVRRGVLGLHIAIRRAGGGWWELLWEHHL